MNSADTLPGNLKAVGITVRMQNVQSGRSPAANATVRYQIPTKDGTAPALLVEQTFVQYREHVYYIARRMLANSADAEDVTQDVFVKVVANLHKFRGESSLVTWLRRITVNAALKHRHRLSTRREVHPHIALEAVIANQESCVPLQRGSASPVHQILDHEMRIAIEQAINRLPTPYRDVYLLADWEGLSNIEVGQRLELTLAAVKTRLNRARLRIRKDLAKYYDLQLSGTSTER